MEIALLRWSSPLNEELTSWEKEQRLNERKLAQGFLVLCLFLIIMRTEANASPVMIVDCHGNSGILVYVRALVYSLLSAATEYRVTSLLLVESTMVNVNGSFVPGAIEEVVGVVNVTKTTLPSEP